jgi:hypothetical protein
MRAEAAGIAKAIAHRSMADPLRRSTQPIDAVTAPEL